MIGIINFTHSDPLYLSIKEKEKIVRENPKNILTMIKEKKLGGGMVSLVSLLENGLNLFRGANIHSISTTMSTLLVSRGEVMSKRMEVAVTSHTRTTEFYLEMVLKGLGIDYKLIHSSHTEADDLLTEADYALVIGDEALKVYRSKLRILLDTGFEFSRLYHLQPLYAAMAYRKDEMPPSEFSVLESAVHPDMKVVNAASMEAASRLDLPESILKRYYSVIRYDYPDLLDRTVEFVSKHLKSGSSGH